MARILCVIMMWKIFFFKSDNSISMGFGIPCNNFKYLYLKTLLTVTKEFFINGFYLLTDLYTNIDSLNVIQK